MTLALDARADSRGDESAHDGIEVRGLRKSFGPAVALDGVDLDVRAGEIVAMLGRNGAGKSTLLRVLGTTVLPDGGSASIAGFDVVTHPAAARRGAGVVLADERSWYWRLSGRANLEFFAALYGLPKRLARARADELLEVVQLADMADRRFDGYSSGMRARLSLARAMLASPRVLLLDEPSRALDPMVAAELRQVVVESSREVNRAVLWVTHDLHEAAAVADRVVVLDAGKILAERRGGTSAATLERLLRHR